MDKVIIDASKVRKAIGFNFEEVFEGASAKTKEWCQKKFGALYQELIWFCRKLWFQIDNGLASSSEQSEEILEALHYLDENRFIRHDIKAKSFRIDYFREVVFAPKGKHALSSNGPIVITQFDDFAIENRFGGVMSLSDHLANERYEEYTLPTKKDLDDFQMGLGDFLGPKGVKVVCYMYGIEDGRLHTNKEAIARYSISDVMAAEFRKKVATRRRPSRRKNLPIVLLSTKENLVKVMAKFEKTLESTLGSVRAQNIVKFGSSFGSKDVSVTLKKAPKRTPKKALKKASMVTPDKASMVAPDKAPMVASKKVAMMVLKRAPMVAQG